MNLNSNWQNLISKLICITVDIGLILSFGKIIISKWGRFSYHIVKQLTLNTGKTFYHILRQLISSRAKAFVSHSEATYIKVALSGQREFLAIESPLKMVKNAFYFLLKALFVLKIFEFLSWLFSHAEKRLDKKDKVNFKIYDFTTWLKNNHNIHIDQYYKKQRQSDNLIWSFNRI